MPSSVLVTLLLVCASIFTNAIVFNDEALDLSMKRLGVRNLIKSKEPRDFAECCIPTNSFKTNSSVSIGGNVSESGFIEEYYQVDWEHQLFFAHVAAVHSDFQSFDVDVWIVQDSITHRYLEYVQETKDRSKCFVKELSDGQPDVLKHFCLKPPIKLAGAYLEGSDARLLWYFAENTTDSSALLTVSTTVDDCMITGSFQYEASVKPPTPKLIHEQAAFSNQGLYVEHFPAHPKNCVTMKDDVVSPTIQMHMRRMLRSPYRMN